MCIRDSIKLLGVLIVIVGFALKLDSILIIFLALIATGIVGGLGVGGLLETIGTNFVANRSMAIFIMILLVTGTLERNGLREAAANLIRKVKSATAGKLVAVYGMLNALFGAFNVSFGGVAGFIRPVLLPMIEGAISNKEGKANEDHVEEAKMCIRDRIEREAMEQLGISLTIHMDPVETRNEEVLQAKHETEKAVEALDPRCSIHDFRMVNGEKQINLIFDFVIPREYSEEKGNELTLTLMDRLQHHNPKYQCVITLDRSYVEEQR